MTRLVLEPFRVGNLDLKNRFVFAPITTRFATARGYVTDRLKAHYEARARGGAGLLVVEATYIEPVGQAFADQLSICDASYIEGLRELTDAIRRHGCACAIQLHHGGRLAKSAFTGMQPVAPSPVPDPAFEVPRELTVDEIRAIVQSFARAAARAEAAGFDGVEIHGAHNYLVDQFLSGASNKRTDSYGGDIANRCRFMVEVIEAARGATGPGFPVWVRINGREYGVRGGTTLEEATEAARRAEKAGAVAVHVSAYGPATPTNRTTATFQSAVIGSLAAAIKREVTVPVIAVGRITPAAAETMLEEGGADLVALGKALLADPEIPNKVAEAREEDIVPCIVCMYCRDALRRPDMSGIRCQVNPRLGSDHEPLPPAPARPKRVLVLGGGPAGMSAALAAAERGHSVTLWERAGQLGGQLLPAAVPPHKDRIAALTRYLVRQVERSGITVATGTVATIEAVQAAAADVIIVATGPHATLPDIPGLEDAGAVFATEVLLGNARTGRRVVIIGGELVGCETAEFLAERGKTVTVVRRGPEMATSVSPSLRQFFLERLARKGVALLPGIGYREARPGFLTVDAADGTTRTIEADTIVVAAGSIADCSLVDGLRGCVAEVRAAGDCVAPRGIIDAVSEGRAAGLAV
jgi:2,4-dienoyl-CoA reductase-like NADH-dependent reductase (Old Yellow Enzyme family)/thioredoxin reductase